MRAEIELAPQKERSAFALCHAAFKLKRMSLTKGTSSQETTAAASEKTADLEHLEVDTPLGQNASVPSHDTTTTDLS